MSSLQCPWLKLTYMYVWIFATDIDMYHIVYCNGHDLEVGIAKWLLFRDGTCLRDIPFTNRQTLLFCYTKRWKMNQCHYMIIKLCVGEYFIYLITSSLWWIGLNGCLISCLFTFFSFKEGHVKFISEGKPDRFEKPTLSGQWWTRAIENWTKNSIAQAEVRSHTC